MEKEKQIEELGKIVLSAILLSRREKRNNCKYGLGGICAEALINAGYGNVKEAVKETARECLKILHSIGGCDATEDYYKGWDKAIDGAYKEISDKYGVTAFDEEDEE